MHNIFTSKRSSSVLKGGINYVCSAMLLETIQYYIDNKSSVYALFLDASNAFDHLKLFKTLLNRKLYPLIIKLLHDIQFNSIVYLSKIHSISDNMIFKYICITK